ncbi:MAG: AraC family transcriptional regulator [Bacteroidales bacterium]|nr:AraC family transcriptional regulator [Bacteroidales bacterium]
MKLLFKYKEGVFFSLILTTCVVMSMWLSRFIPDQYFDNVITPILMVCATTVECIGAWILFSHSGGLRVRKAFAWALVVWGLADGAYILSWMTSPTPVMNMGAYQISTFELMLGNLLGWVLLLYPAEALRPGWMNIKRALWQLLPMFALAALDYAVPVNLQPIIALYPFVLISLLLGHIRAYQNWCEENFSSLEDIDVEWIMRYLLMMVLVGVVYMFMCLTHAHARGFTQQWLVVFMFIYATEQILFRKDPWELLRKKEKAEDQTVQKQLDVTHRQKLEEWMEKEKPYRNPDFRLLDLQQILPMNRTYLSQFIHNEYGCTFYQFVNRYRIEESMRLKREKPDLKVQEVSALCGFSSPTVFSRTFTSITGLSPREWAKQINSA